VVGARPARAIYCVCVQAGGCALFIVARARADSPASRYRPSSSGSSLQTPLADAADFGDLGLAVSVNLI